jgi:hypothetical protein
MIKVARRIAPIHTSTIASYSKGNILYTIVMGQVLLSPILFYFLYPHTEDIVSFMFQGMGRIHMFLSM